MHARQVAVEHDHVVVVDRGTRETGRAVERDVHGHAGLAQTERDRLRHLLVVLDHKHSHGHSSFTAGLRFWSGVCSRLLPGGFSTVSPAEKSTAWAAIPSRNR